MRNNRLGLVTGSAGTGLALSLHRACTELHRPMLPSRSVLGLSLLALGLATSPCRASEDVCPPGYWCSDEPEEPGSTEAASKLTLEPLPETAPRPLRRRHALTLHVTQAMALNDNGATAPTLTGVGLGFRVRPMAWLGIEPAIELMRGYDELHAPHSETALSTDLLLYLNPRNAIQVFGVAGAQLGVAQHSEHWSQASSTYVGAQLGAGLEFRVTHLLSFNVNVVGYTRRVTGEELRKSSTGRSIPEASSGLALRASAGFYF